LEKRTSTPKFTGFADLDDDDQDAFQQILMKEVSITRDYDRDHMFPVAKWRLLMEIEDGMDDPESCMRATFSIWNVKWEFWGKNLAKKDNCIYQSWYEQSTGKWYFYVPEKERFMNVLQLQEAFGDRLLDEDDTILFEDWNSGWPSEKTVAMSLEKAQELLAQRMEFIGRMEAGSHASTFRQYVKSRGDGFDFSRERRIEQAYGVNDFDPEYDPDEEEDEDDDNEDDDSS
jgi:hypothetical protein